MSVFLFFFSFSEMNPKEILHMTDCTIVIMTDESQKWKIASLECALDIFGLFSSFLLLSPLFPLFVSYYSLPCSLLYSLLPLLFSLIFDSLTLPLLSLSFIYPYVSLLCYIVCPPFYSSLLFSSHPALLSLAVPTSLQLPFVPVCQKSASITGCCYITAAIMQI